MALDKINRIAPTGPRVENQPAAEKPKAQPKIDTFALGNQGLAGKFSAGAPVGGAARFLAGSYDAKGLAVCKTVGFSNMAGCENLRPAIVKDLETLMTETA